LAPYAEQFVAELTDFCRLAYPGREFVRHAPLPRNVGAGEGET
jgi:hypothetical protein